MSEQLTDQMLVERVQKGDQQSFNLLVIRYQHKVGASYPGMYLRAMSLMLFRNLLLKRIAHWSHFVVIALFIRGYIVLL